MRGMRNSSGSHDTDDEDDDLKKDLPPEYQVALEMPKPDIEDYTRFFEYTLVHSSSSISGRTVRLQNVLEHPDNEPSASETVPKHPVNAAKLSETQEELPTYEEYVHSLGEMTPDGKEEV